VGRDIVDCIAIRYELDRSEIESQYGRIFRICLDRPWGLPNFLYNGYSFIPRDKAAGTWR